MDSGTSGNYSIGRENKVETFLRLAEDLKKNKDSTHKLNLKIK
jgi:hypothetical protein